MFLVLSFFFFHVSLQCHSKVTLIYPRRREMLQIPSCSTTWYSSSNSEVNVLSVWSVCPRKLWYYIFIFCEIVKSCTSVLLITELNELKFSVKIKWVLELAQRTINLNLLSEVIKFRGKTWLTNIFTVPKAEFNCPMLSISIYWRILPVKSGFNSLILVFSGCQIKINCFWSSCSNWDFWITIFRVCGSSF